MRLTRRSMYQRIHHFFYRHRMFRANKPSTCPEINKKNEKMSIQLQHAKHENRPFQSLLLYELVFERYVDALKKYKMPSFALRGKEIASKILFFDKNV